MENVDNCGRLFSKSCFVLFCFDLHSDYNLDCMPPHGYIHVLSLTDNIAEFRNAVNKQKISGNIDTPEGGFDAMLQAAVCQVRSVINKRPNGSSNKYIYIYICRCNCAQCS